MDQGVKRTTFQRYVVRQHHARQAAQTVAGRWQTRTVAGRTQALQRNGTGEGVSVFEATEQDDANAAEQDDSNEYNQQTMALRVCGQMRIAQPALAQAHLRQQIDFAAHNRTVSTAIALANGD